MNVTKILRTTMLAASFTIVPAAAFGVSVSSNDGSGNQARGGTYASVSVTGTLKSTTGKNVYYSGKIAKANCSDIDTGRYSTNTKSTSAVDKGGSISGGAIGACTFFPTQGVKSRICKVNKLLPDGCGSDSLTY